MAEYESNGHVGFLTKVGFHCCDVLTLFGAKLTPYTVGIMDLPIRLKRLDNAAELCLPLSAELVTVRA